MKIHILGIGGTFMAGIAILAKELGHQVTGSDKKIFDPMKTVLINKKIKVYNNYSKNNLDNNTDLVIVGNIMSRGMPIVEYLLQSNIKYISGPQWLNENILVNKTILAVSGTHGKTTTSSALAWLLECAGIKPSYLIGGQPNNFKYPARLTKSKYFVIEADEYDTSFFDKRSKFIHYKPNVLIINNIEFDHADIFEDINAIIKSFHHLIRIIPKNGQIIYDNNDKIIKQLFRHGTWSKLTPLSVNKNTKSIWNLRKEKGQYTLFKNNTKKLLSSDLIGIHNYKNLSLAIIAALQLKIPMKKLLEGIKSFSGVKRRMEKIQSKGHMTIYDDFAHHPTEISNSISAIKDKYKNKRILSICEVKSNSMIQGVHKKNLYNALSKSNISLVVKKRSIKWSFSGNNNKIFVIDSCSKITDYIKSHIGSIDVILIMSNGNTDNIIKAIKVYEKNN